MFNKLLQKYKITEEEKQDKLATCAVIYANIWVHLSILSSLLLIRLLGGFQSQTTFEAGMSLTTADIICTVSMLVGVVAVLAVVHVLYFNFADRLIIRLTYALAILFVSLLITSIIINYNKISVYLSSFVWDTQNVVGLVSAIVTAVGIGFMAYFMLINEYNK